MSVRPRGGKPAFVYAFILQQNLPQVLILQIQARPQCVSSLAPGSRALAARSDVCLENWERSARKRHNTSQKSLENPSRGSDA